MKKQIKAIILFDGVCNLCNAGIQFIIKRDPNRYFRYAPLQSKFGQEVLEKFKMPKTDFDTFVLVHGDRSYTKSTAALKIAARLKGIWPLFGFFFIVPPFVRDAVYGFVAKNRYRWFGKKESCMIPTPELKSLFLD